MRISDAPLYSNKEYVMVVIPHVDVSGARWRMSDKSKEKYRKKQVNSAPRIRLRDQAINSIIFGIHPETIGQEHMRELPRFRHEMMRDRIKSQEGRATVDDAIKGILIGLLSDECPHRHDVVEILRLAERIDRENPKSAQKYLADIGSTLRDLALQDYARRKYERQLEYSVEQAMIESDDALMRDTVNNTLESRGYQPREITS